MSKTNTSVPVPSPVEISRAGQHDIRIRWNDATDSVFIARKLRLECPCAHCVDETTGLRILKEPSVPQDVHPKAIEPVGRYGISIHWSDGHNTGIYIWERLYSLAHSQG